MATGTVKFFNAEKGFGFIISDETKQEILVYSTDYEESVIQGVQMSFGIDL